MIRKSLFIIACLFGLATTGKVVAEIQPQTVGIVNFAKCMTESKIGKQEQASFDSMKTQMSTSLEALEKQITEISAKFNDREYLDSLSPQAEEELKTKFRNLNDELASNQNQYYQLINQANMHLLQMIASKINKASEKIAREKKLAMIINKEATFFYIPGLDITKDVISEMDHMYDEAAAKKAEAEKVNTVKTEEETKQ